MLVKEADRVLRTVASQYEIIVIDDGSTDDSRAVLTRLTRNISKLRLVLHDNNLGYGGALRSGFRESKYELVFYTDGDGQYDVTELPILLSLMTQDTDFVNGIKMTRHDPSYRIVLGNLYSFLVRWAFWVPITDVDCDFRLIRKNVLRRMSLHANSGAICIELVKKAQRAGAVMRQVSVHHLERKNGISQFFRWDRLLTTAWEVLGLWVNLMFLRRTA